MKPRACLHLLLVACAAAMSATLASASATPNPPAAGHAYAEREHAFTVALPPAEAFVFFEPLGEKKWAEGWQPVFTSPADARLHDGSVFTVESVHPHGGMISSVWTVSRYEPPRLIEYRNVLLGLRATRITVSCEPLAGGTRVMVRYTYHGLSDQGDTLIARITPAAYAAMIESWGTDIAAYLRRGTPASP
jgi:hypothetical protein